MGDEFQTGLAWVTPLLRRPASAFFAAGTTERAILERLQQGWGERDTAELLRELSAEYGEMAGRTVERFLELNIRRDWPEIGAREAHPGTEIEDFIRVLWEPLRAQGFEFTFQRDATSATAHVTRCPLAELGRRTGMHGWIYHLACSTDFHMTQAFCSRIAFSRTRNLSLGDGFCNHQYRYLPATGGGA